MSGVRASLRRFLESIAELEERQEVRRVERNEDGEKTLDVRMQTIADEPFVDLHEDLSDPDPEDQHLFDDPDDADGRGVQP